jgi:hypothetical protein
MDFTWSARSRWRSSRSPSPRFGVGGARTIDAKPAFRIAAPELARLPVRSKVILSWHGRVETRHYGQIYDRDMDLTVALIMPRERPGQNHHRRPARHSRHQAAAQPPRRLQYLQYDLETRFGPLRATDVRVDTDGRWKQCLTYYSRFPSESIVLAGWYCDASGSKPSADRLACLLDRLVLDSPLESREADLFMREPVGAYGALLGFTGDPDRRHALAR